MILREQLIIVLEPPEIIIEYDKKFFIKLYHTLYVGSVEKQSRPYEIWSFGPDVTKDSMDFPYTITCTLT